MCLHWYTSEKSPLLPNSNQTGSIALSHGGRGNLMTKGMGRISLLESSKYHKSQHWYHVSWRSLDQPHGAIEAESWLPASSVAVSSVSHISSVWRCLTAPQLPSVSPV